MATEIVPLTPAPRERFADLHHGLKVPPATLATLRLLAKGLDELVTVPGTRIKLGADSLLGLIPGVGDLVGAVIGSYILVTAARLGVPKAVLARMLMNVGTDAAVGAVPFAGDLLDVAWRANSKNVRLLEDALQRPQEARRTSTWTIVGLVAAVFALAVGGIALAVWLGMTLFRQFGG